MNAVQQALEHIQLIHRGFNQFKASVASRKRPVILAQPTAAGVTLEKDRHVDHPRERDSALARWLPAPGSGAVCRQASVDRAAFGVVREKIN